MSFSTIKFELILQFFFVSIASFAKGEDGCKSMAYLDCVSNKSFTGHVIKTSKIPVPALAMCQNQCFEEDQCVSYNLGPVDGVIRTCELNAADHWIRPAGFLIAKVGFEYCPIENPCSSSPCPANRLCTPNFKWDTYSCDAGGWTQWSPWSSCIMNCGPSTHIRTRTCTNPPPQNNDTQCDGLSSESYDCGFLRSKTYKITYLGCYGDANSNRALPRYLGGGNKCSCGLKSLSKNFTIYGLQNYGECWSGMGDYDKHGTSSACTSAGNGVPYSNDVYHLVTL